MTIKMTAEENAIVEYIESGEAQSVDDVENEINRYAQMNKQKAISIRLLESDIERIKAKSVSQGSD
ncbi:hypothetical protein KEF85_00765 [Methylomonas paludis]|uniref:Uncharacterized protein n=1 Tax=Methylomonas paludis TaxID=1173101 RepID=A0A975MPE2_9GAMM|nr:hypothetical protein [Methylomonas paludis]QWF71066.1 hypothetical protein KEF85_00765 [Methylomonas paludis]